MERHIVEILVILLRQYSEGVIQPDEFDPLTEDLMDLGYTRQEIESAFFWFYNRGEGNTKSLEVESIETESFRILHEVEKAALSPEAYGYLIELRHLGILSLVDLDRIIEKAVLLGGRNVSVEEIKSFVANTLMESEETVQIPSHAYYLKIPSEKVQ